MSMTPRGKESSDPRRPETPWLASAMIGLTISTLATSAMVVGATLALGQAMTRRE